MPQEKHNALNISNWYFSKINTKCVEMVGFPKDGHKWLILIVDAIRKDLVVGTYVHTYATYIRMLRTCT